MHNAFYLKYRPQTLSQLIGQEAVKKNLLSSFQNNKLSHAYLLVGPRGTGKTSTARILAKMVNCSAKQNIPCNECAECLSITDGSNLDLIEIDAASNRGIEDIRSLRDKIKLAPTSAKKKVYIIDEVHMLTAEAFNALLKTLEEPPTHALFILATTESQKIPQTIISRVQRLDFKLATQGELLEALSKIVKAEKIDIDEEAINLLVKKSDGSFRDGVKLLDQVASIGEKVTAKLIEQSFKSGQFESILDLIKDFSSPSAALMNINKQLEGGADAKSLILMLMDVFRNLMLIKNGVGEQLVKSDLTEDKYENLLSLSQGFTNHDLIKNLDILQEAIKRASYAGKIDLVLDCAASSFYHEGYYHLPEKMTKEKLLAYYERLIEKYKLISVEDPFEQDDFSGFAELRKRTGVQIVGDDLTVTNPKRLAVAIHERSCSCLLLKLNQIGTLTEALGAVRLAYAAGWKVMVSHRSGETEDDFIADLAVGIGCGQLKAGAPCRGERTAKYNRLLRIWEMLGKKL